MNTTALVLASASPRRHKILTAMGLVFEVVVSAVEEVHWLDDPKGTVRENAARKCMWASERQPDVTVIAASATEFLAALLLLSGLLSRIGGLLGIGTMAPAIYSTAVLMRMTPEDLPGGLTEVPFVPPMPVPVLVLIASLVVLVLGGGSLSVDRMVSGKSAGAGAAEA